MEPAPPPTRCLDAHPGRQTGFSTSTNSASTRKPGQMSAQRLHAIALAGVVADAR
jgi:hypothetical protein